MRRTIARAAAVLTAMMLAGGVYAQQQAPQPPPAAPKPAQPAPGSLEELLAQALKNNPDIRVADAKVREAEAELHRARLGVANKVATLYHSIEGLRKVRDEVQQRWQRAERLHQQAQAAISMEEVRAARLNLDKANSDLARAEAEMTGLLGKLPGADAADKVRLEQVLRQDQAVLHALEFLGRVQHIVEGQLTVVPQGTLAERIRKALDTRIDGNYKGKALHEVLADLEKKFDGIPVRDHVRPPEGKMDIDLGQVPLGAALQALNDLAPDLRFVVRDYGVLVTNKDLLPPGAVLLHDFWKSGPRPDAKLQGADASNPPPGEVEGLVKQVDAGSGLVTITVGSDAGLAKGHTLQVYRLQPAPKYLGRVRVLDVKPQEAVVKPDGKVTEPIRPGDRVASKLQRG